MERQENDATAPGNSPAPGRPSCIVQDKGRQRWIIFSTCFASFMCVLDNFIVNISLPTIAHDFNIGTAAVARVVIVYLLVLTSTIPVFGKLGDRQGLTRVFTAGFIVFTMGSLLCGISVSITMLILSRVIQALGGAILFALPAAIVPRFLPAGMRGASFGALATSSALGLSLGAPIGGIIATHFSWHFIFLINVPVGILAIYMIRKFFPRDDTPGTPHHFDLPGVFLSFFGLASLLYCLNNGTAHGWTSPPIIIAFTISMVMLAAFIAWERKCSDPLVDLRILRHRDYTLANLANFFQFMVLAGNGFLLPFYLIQVKGLQPDRAGLIIMIYSLVLMIVGPLSGKASDRIAPRILCSVGALLAMGACFFFSQALAGQGLWQTIIFLMWLGMSFALFVPPNNNLIMSSTPVEEQGTASAMLKTITNMGSAFGVCFFETVFTMGIPGDLLKMGGSLAHDPLFTAPLLAGLHTSYLCACGISFLTLVCMLFAKDPAKKAPK